MNLISFSLWGTSLKYLRGAIENAKLAKKIYPDWHMIVFTDNIISDTAFELVEHGAIVTRFPFSGVGKYYWRHCIPDVFPEGVERYIVRDCDSRLNPREKAAVDAWIESGRTYHFMRDHPKHTIPWMQGMYGVKGYSMRGLTQKLQTVLDQYGGINWLFTEMYGHIKPEDRLEHGEFYTDQFPEQQPFPTARENYRFVGEIFDENNEPNGDWHDLEPAQPTP